MSDLWMNETAGSTVKFKGNIFTAAKSAVKFSCELNKGCKDLFKEALKAFLTRKVTIPTKNKNHLYLSRANELISSYREKNIAFRIITPLGFDEIEKRGMAQDYIDQCIIRTWPYKSISHPGHAALSVKSGEGEKHAHTYVSWWASEESTPGRINTKTGTKGELLNKVYGYSQINYLQDKYCEMSDRARSKLAAAKYALEKVKSGNFTKDELSAAEVKLREKQKSLPKWGEDAFGVSADKVYIPPQGVNRNKKTGEYLYNIFGLNRKEMENEWAEVQKQEMAGVATYKMISNEENCAGMVLRVLKKGGSDIYIDNKKLSFFVNTANNVHRYAIQLQQKIDSLNEMANKLGSNFYHLEKNKRDKIMGKLPLVSDTAMYITKQAGFRKDPAERAFLKKMSKYLDRIHKARNKREVLQHSVKFLELINKLDLQKESDNFRLIAGYSMHQIISLLKKFD